MRNDIIKELESKGFEQLTNQTYYNHKTKVEVILMEEEASVSNGRQKLFMGKIENGEKILEVIN